MTHSRGPYTIQVDQFTEHEWNSLLEKFADATIYQTRSYGAVSWGEQQLSHLAVTREGTPVAIAQCRIIRVPLIGKGIAYVRWGPLWTPRNSPCDPSAWRTAMEALVEEYVERRGLALRVTPHVFREDPVARSVALYCDRAGFESAGVAASYRTLRVDLRPAVDSIRSRLAHKWRNQLNAAERNGLEVRAGTETALYDEFEALYRQMMGRKQFDTTVSVTQFRRIQEQLPPTQKMLILIAYKDGRALNGVVASTIGATGIYLLGATGDEGMKSKGAYLLQWHLLQQLKERGCTWYDLGGINAESNPGVYHFKKGLGGDEILSIGRYDLHRSRLTKFGLSVAERFKRRGGRSTLTTA